MTRQEIKEFSKERLGRKIFGNIWMMGLLICVIFSAIEAAAGTVIVGVGSLIVMGPMTYGLSWVFLKLARDGQAPNIGDLFSGFTTDFGQNFLIGLLTQIFTFLWSLLFVIPGIIKSYAYSLAYYIKADHPDYDWRQCIKGSCEMMKGHKWEMFVLDLSFLGWYIVGALCAGVGVLWVAPYHMEARAVFYDQLCGQPVMISGCVDSTAADGGSWYTE